MLKVFPILSVRKSCASSLRSTGLGRRMPKCTRCRTSAGHLGAKVPRGGDIVLDFSYVPDPKGSFISRGLQTVPDRIVHTALVERSLGKGLAVLKQ